MSHLSTQIIYTKQIDVLLELGFMLHVLHVEQLGEMKLRLKYLCIKNLLRKIILKIMKMLDMRASSIVLILLKKKNLLLLVIN